MKNMYKRIGCVLLFCGLLAGSLNAEVNYSYRKLIENGEFTKAAGKISDDLQKNPHSIASLYAAYCLKTTPVSYNTYFNEVQAYEHLKQADQSWDVQTDKERKALTKMGITPQVVSDEMDSFLQRQWTSARQKNTVEAYTFLLTHFDLEPDSVRRQAAQLRVAAAWRDARQTNTKAAYQIFISTYPDAQETDEAKNRIDDLDWNALNRQSNKKSAYQQYLAQYPDGRHAATAQAELATIMEKEDYARLGKNVNDRIRFLKKYPETSYRQDLSQKIVRSLEQTDDLPLLQNAETVLQGEYLKTVQQRIASLERLESLKREFREKYHIPDTIYWDYSETKTVWLEPSDYFPCEEKFYDGLLCVRSGVTGKCGFLNEQGEWAIPMSMKITDSEPRFVGGYCVCHLETNGKSELVVIDKTGKITARLAGYNNCTDFCNDGYALAEKITQIPNSYRTKQKLVFINPQGKEIMPVVYQDAKYTLDNILYNDYYILEGHSSNRYYECNRCVRAYDFSEGLAPYYDYIAGLWGYIDRTGKKVIPARYHQVHSFVEGLAAVQMPVSYDDAPRKWGFINPKGEMLIAPQFTNEPHDFSCGRAVITKTNEWQVFIDKAGNIVSDEYPALSDFTDNVAFAKRANFENNCILDTACQPIVEINHYWGVYADDEIKNGLRPLLGDFNDSNFCYDLLGNRVEYVGHGENREENRIDFYDRTTGKVLFLIRRKEL